MSTSRGILLTGAAAVTVFCIVQDLVIVAGTRRYVRLQREALAGRGPVLTVEEVMDPAVDESVTQGVLWGGATAALGAASLLRSQRGSNQCRTG